MDQGPERDYTLDEYGRVVHYGPGDRPLCGNDAVTTVFTDDPALVAGCVDCLELAAEDLVQDNEHWANCLHCQQEISAQSGVEWRRTGASPDPGVEGARVGAAGVSGSSVGPVCRCPVKIPAVTMSISKVIDPGSILACAGEPLA